MHATISSTKRPQESLKRKQRGQRKFYRELLSVEKRKGSVGGKKVNARIGERGRQCVGRFWGGKAGKSE